MYAITGITGHVGSGAANILLTNNLPVKAVLRNESKARQWLTKGAEIAIAELHDEQALQVAFEGTHGVFIMTPPLFDSPNPIADHDLMLAALTLAIEKAKPGKVVYLSSIGAHLPAGTGAIKKLYDMEQLFQKLRIPTVGIRAAWFMENFTGGIAPAKASGQLSSFLNPTDMSIPMIATKDIGKLAAELLQQTWTGHRIIELEGPCQYSANDVAAILSGRLNRNISAKAITADDYEAVYQSFGCSTKASSLMAEMNNGFNSRHIVFEKNGHEHITGETLLEDALSAYINS
ncbi:MAG: NmrA family NAD(P)-binding protein [Mucilaginibacter sp.]|uniref:NmrA family NAD(P)-binding protein n=1 Tax=Mucilaginibacter sp. TaxID=1882438 RepID=UPI0031AAFC4D